jgi:hypothetical protein
VKQPNVTPQRKPANPIPTGSVNPIRIRNSECDICAYELTVSLLSLNRRAPELAGPIGIWPYLGGRSIDVARHGRRSGNLDAQTPNFCGTPHVDCGLMHRRWREEARTAGPDQPFSQSRTFPSKHRGCGYGWSKRCPESPQATVRPTFDATRVSTRSWERFDANGPWLIAATRVLLPEPGSVGAGGVTCSVLSSGVELS